MEDLIKKPVDLAFGAIEYFFPKRGEVETVIIKEVEKLSGPMSGAGFVRFAGLAGGTAVIMAAYGAHVIFILSSANAFYLDHATSLSFGKELRSYMGFFSFIFYILVECMYQSIHFVCSQSDDQGPYSPTILENILSLILQVYISFPQGNDEETMKAKAIFESGNKMHIMHSLALMGVPLTNRPRLVGSLMITGMAIFSGTCYYTAITGNRNVRKFTPYGGMLLIISWFLMLL